MSSSHITIKTHRSSQVHSFTLKSIPKNPIIGLADKFVTGKEPFNISRVIKVSESIFRGPNIPIDKIRCLAEDPEKKIKMILDLRTIEEKEAKKLEAEAKKYGMVYKNIPLDPFNITKSVIEIAKMVVKASPENRLYIHCTFGIDRTGFVTALGSYLRKEKTIPAAIQDMHDKGFQGVRGVIFYNFIRFLQEIDKRITPIAP